MGWVPPSLSLDHLRILLGRLGVKPAYKLFWKCSQDRLMLGLDGGILLQEMYDYQQQHAVASQDGRVSDLLGDQVGKGELVKGVMIFRFEMQSDGMAYCRG